MQVRRAPRDLCCSWHLSQHTVMLRCLANALKRHQSSSEPGICEMGKCVDKKKKKRKKRATCDLRAQLAIIRFPHSPTSCIGIYPIDWICAAVQSMLPLWGVGGVSVCTGLCDTRNPIILMHVVCVRMAPTHVVVHHQVSPVPQIVHSVRFMDRNKKPWGQMFLWNQQRVTT